ncbi:hypothetical protein BDK51DRAFT_31880 [Blyttiomyces helicus]|uniref:Uncharacterized protein n=1 Tax=Blyttiomyces helicus TaxID=388810 RepID=A0A4P9W8C3_9FUNG|nr:hypothetical protein BDK51DRAFT_31880 [Blyttiomyces helicus]|eukprot:RKO86416.1 hypothetical protein BDK51DRAFT_31880 [Blyttiomyces helicus]
MYSWSLLVSVFFVPLFYYIFREGINFVAFLKGQINMFDMDRIKPRAGPVCLKANPRAKEWISRGQVLRTKPPNVKFGGVANYDHLWSPTENGGVSEVTELEIATGGKAHDKLIYNNLFGECSFGVLDATIAEMDICAKALMRSLQCGGKLQWDCEKG